ncbi:unnamed protein product [Tuber aestivum]|uniref:Uncharacterized protein n=1 Tax=Tuber aestivum TaxID=59557 RepID=A0A292PKS6_9PEZI|nr:unnamed protein product [Tuber aestivum]
MEAMLVRSPLASYCFTSNARANVRVCYQGQRGRIGMSSYDEKSGWAIEASPGSALLNNGIAVTGWDYGDEERVYFIGKGDKIFEVCYEQIFRNTVYTTYQYLISSAAAATGVIGRTAAHYSNLAAISFEGNDETRQIRVFFQAKDNIIHEVCGDGEGNWREGQTFSAATPATCIASSQDPDRAYYYRLFYQKPNTAFIEYVKEEDIEWQEDSHRVFTVNSHNRLCITECGSGDDWSNTRTITRTMPSSPTTAVSAIGDPVPVRVYFQVQGSQITEWGTDNDMVDYDVITESVPTQGSG